MPSVGGRGQQGLYGPHEWESRSLQRPLVELGVAEGSSSARERPTFDAAAVSPVQYMADVVAAFVPLSLVAARVLQNPA